MGWMDSEEERRGIYARAAKLWAYAFNNANPGESANALAALRRLQSEQHHHSWGSPSVRPMSSN